MELINKLKYSNNSKGEVIYIYTDKRRVEINLAFEKSDYHSFAFFTENVEVLNTIKPKYLRGIYYRINGGRRRRYDHNIKRLFKINSYVLNELVLVFDSITIIVSINSEDGMGYPVVFTSIKK